MFRPLAQRQRQYAVAVVDDDPDVAGAVADSLAVSGEDLTAEAIEDAETVVDRVERGEVDCVLSDYAMEPVDGLELLHRLRDAGHDLPFILFTGRGNEAVASEAIGAGATDYMVKGRTEREFEVLAEKIKQFVGNHEHRRRAELAVDALESAQEGIALIDTAGRFTYANRAYAELFDADRDELVGAPWRQLYDEDTAETIENQVLPAVDRHGVWHNGMLARGDAAVDLPHEVRIVGRSGGGYIWTAQDVTELKRTEERLEREQAYLDSAINALDEIYYVVDETGALLRWNDRLNEVTGFTDDELARMHASDLIAENDVNDVVSAIDDVIDDVDGDGSGRIRAELVTADGDGAHFELTGAPLRNAGGEIVGLCGTGRRVGRSPAATWTAVWETLGGR